jgi:hypothetical protein
LFDLYVSEITSTVINAIKHENPNKMLTSKTMCSLPILFCQGNVEMAREFINELKPCCASNE